MAPSPRGWGCLPSDSTHPQGPRRALAGQDAMNTGVPPPSAWSTGQRITPPGRGPEVAAGADAHNGAAVCRRCSALTFFRKAIRGRWRCPWSSRVTVMVPGRAARCGAAGKAGWRRGDPNRTHLATATRLLSLPRAAPVLCVAANQHPPPHAYLHEGVGRRRCRLGALAGARSARGGGGAGGGA